MHRAKPVAEKLNDYFVMLWAPSKRPTTNPLDVGNPA